MDREAFQGIGFQEGFEILYRCPACNSHLLMGTVRRVETAGTRAKRKQNFENFKLEDCDEHFSTDFKCVSPRCGQIIICVGRVITWEHPSTPGSNETSFEERLYFPQFFTPHLHVFQIPHGTPPKVRDAINASFNLLFVSSGSALNEIRNSLEFLMDELGVPRKEKGQDGQEMRIDLDRRVGKVPGHFRIHKQLLLAVKSVGNWGSHAVDTDRHDVLNAYELLNHVLDEMFSGRKQRLTELAKDINNQKREVRVSVSNLPKPDGD